MENEKDNTTSQGEPEQAGRPTPQPQQKVEKLTDLRKGAEGIIIEPGPPTENPFQEFRPPEGQVAPGSAPVSQAPAAEQSAAQVPAATPEQGGDAGDSD